MRAIQLLIPSFGLLLSLQAFAIPKATAPFPPYEEALLSRMHTPQAFDQFVQNLPNKSLLILGTSLESVAGIEPRIRQMGPDWVVYPSDTREWSVREKFWKTVFDNHPDKQIAVMDWHFPEPPPDITWEGFFRFEAKQLRARPNTDFVELGYVLPLKLKLRYPKLPNIFVLPDWGEVRIGAAVLPSIGTDSISTKKRTLSQQLIKSAHSELNKPIGSTARLLAQTKDGIWLLIKPFHGRLSEDEVLRLSLWKLGLIDKPYGFVHDAEGRSYYATNFDNLGPTHTMEPDQSGLSINDLESIRHQIETVKELGLFSHQLVFERQTHQSSEEHTFFRFIRNQEGELRLTLDENASIPLFPGSPFLFSANEDRRHRPVYVPVDELAHVDVSDLLMFEYFKSAKMPAAKSFIEKMMRENRFDTAFSLAQVAVALRDEEAMQWLGVQTDKSVEALSFIKKKHLKYHSDKHFEKILKAHRVSADVLGAPDANKMYQRMAVEFWSSDNGSQFVLKRPDGTFLKFDKKTKEFSILTPHRNLMTYYILDPEFIGITEENYLGQNMVERKRNTKCGEKLAPSRVAPRD